MVFLGAKCVGYFWELIVGYFCRTLYFLELYKEPDIFLASLAKMQIYEFHLRPVMTFKARILIESTIYSSRDRSKFRAINNIFYSCFNFQMMETFPFSFQI